MLSRTRVASSLLLLGCGFWLYLTVQSSQTGSNALRLVKHKDAQDGRSYWYKHNDIVRHHRPGFVARVRRQIDDSQEEIEKSELPVESARHSTETTGKSHSKRQYLPINSFAPMGNYYPKLFPEPIYLPYPPQGVQSLPEYINSEIATNHLAPPESSPVKLNQLNFPGTEVASAPTGQNRTPLFCVLVPAAARNQFSPQVPPQFKQNDKTYTTYEEIMKRPLNQEVYTTCLVECGRETTLECPDNQRRCATGAQCVPNSSWCDKEIDCADASDESGCTCLDRISDSKRCDNYQDCPDGEDELGCFGCSEEEFSCHDENGTSSSLEARCVRLDQHCDGKEDCASGRDERGCVVLNPELKFDYKNNSHRVGFDSGFIHVFFENEWRVACADTFDLSAGKWAARACESVLGSLSSKPHVQLAPNPLRSSGSYATLVNGVVHKADTCEILYKVQCPEPVLGSRMTPQDELVSVVGGRASSPQSWPFIVAISKNGKFHCGGAIVNERWILSAAHCFRDYHNNYFEIDAGSVRRLSYAPSLQTRKIVGLVIHQEYDPLIMSRDIALALLERGLQFNGMVRPVQLPPAASPAYYGWRTQDPPSLGARCVVAGWGSTTEGGPDPDHLREVDVPVVPCRHYEDINRYTICAGYVAGGRDSCQGDSGGPLMCRMANANDQWYIGGIVSHGIGCGRMNEPGTYTKVSNFVSWINSVINSRKSPESLSRPLSDCPGFSCSRSHPRCLPGSKRCDRRADCLGAEDEIDCPPPTNNRTVFRTTTRNFGHPHVLQEPIDSGN